MFPHFLSLICLPPEDLSSDAFAFLIVCCVSPRRTGTLPFFDYDAACGMWNLSSRIRDRTPDSSGSMET